MKYLIVILLLTSAAFAQLPTQLSDGTTFPAKVQPASTTPAYADKALTATLSPNSTGIPINLPNATAACGSVTASGTTVTCSATPASAFDTLIGLCTVNNTGTIAISDNQANTWNTAKSQTGTVAGALVSFEVLPTVASTTFTCTAGSTGVVSITVYDVSGLLAQVAAQPDLTDAKTAASQTSALTNAALMPNFPNELSFTALALTTNNACTAGTNYTIDTQQGATGGRLCPIRRPLPDVTMSVAAGSTLATFTSASYAQATAVFQPVAISVSGTVRVQSTACGMTDFTQAWVAVPTSSTAATATTTCALTIAFSNTNSSSQTVTVTDNQGSPVSVISAFSIPANSVMVMNLGGTQFTSGIKWSAGGTGVTGAITGKQ